jgi:hypothetical protein
LLFFDLGGRQHSVSDMFALRVANRAWLASPLERETCIGTTTRTDRIQQSGTESQLPSIIQAAEPDFRPDPSRKPSLPALQCLAPKQLEMALQPHGPKPELMSKMPIHIVKTLIAKLEFRPDASAQFINIGNAYRQNQKTTPGGATLFGPILAC